MSTPDLKRLLAIDMLGPAKLLAPTFASQKSLLPPLLLLTVLLMEDLMLISAVLGIVVIVNLPGAMLSRYLA